MSVFILKTKSNSHIDLSLAHVRSTCSSQISDGSRRHRRSAPSWRRETEVSRLLLQLVQQTSESEWETGPLRLSARSISEPALECPVLFVTSGLWNYAASCCSALRWRKPRQKMTAWIQEPRLEGEWSRTHTEMWLILQISLNVCIFIDSVFSIREQEYM